ncbi:hypothetical protein H9L39_11708 [Fusarium oxysporum f. sp. albedinis]|nr:hypothetical protein H9L39_11708 [Fusarium oxysporum f. sp. albedinis]
MDGSKVKLSTNIRLYWRLCYHAVSPLAPAKERRLFTQSHGSCAVVRLTFGWKTTLAAAEKLQGRENRYRKKAHDTYLYCLPTYVKDEHEITESFAQYPIPSLLLNHFISRR